MRHRAVSRYKYPTYRGKKISNREAQRRIAQSYGYKHTLAVEQPNQEVKALIL